MTSINCVPLGKCQFRLLFQYLQTGEMTNKKVEQDIECVLEKYIDDDSVITFEVYYFLKSIH